jgi:hypothetical protein
MEELEIFAYFIENRRNKREKVNYNKGIKLNESSLSEEIAKLKEL